MLSAKTVGAPLPPAPTFLLLFPQCPRALTPLGLKKTETTATQATKTEDPWISLPVISCLYYLMQQDCRMFVYHKYESVIYPHTADHRCLSLSRAMA